MADSIASASSINKKGMLMVDVVKKVSLEEFQSQFRLLRKRLHEIGVD